MTAPARQGALVVDEGDLAWLLSISTQQESGVQSCTAPPQNPMAPGHASGGLTWI